jgi:hypothetical protein
MTATENKILELTEVLIQRINEECSGNKKYCWIDKEELISAIRFGVVTVVTINEDKTDGTFSTIVRYSGHDFIYVGDQILFQN